MTTSTVHRVGTFLRHLPFGDALLERLPESARDVLREIRDAASDPSEASDVRVGEVGTGTSVRAVAFAVGAVREGASVRAVDVLKGDVDGGSVRAVNVIVGDVLRGDVGTVNVIFGDVHGGVLRDVHLIVGDVTGGRLERVYAVIGDVVGGEGRVTRVIGRVRHGGVEVGDRVEP